MSSNKYFINKVAFAILFFSFNSFIIAANHTEDGEGSETHPIAEQPTAAQLKDLGLKGIFPQEMPDGLSDEQWSLLEGDGLVKLGTQTAADVTAFYTSVQEGNLDSQLKALDKLRTRLSELKIAKEDPRNSAQSKLIYTLYSKLNRRVALANAMLKTLALNDGQMSQSPLEGVKIAASQLRAALNARPGGAAWLPYFRVDAIEKAISEGDKEKTKSLLAEIQKRLTDNKDFSDAQKKFFSEVGEISLYATATSKAIQAEGSISPEIAQAQKLRGELKTLADSAEDFWSNHTQDSANKVRDSYEGLTKTAPDKGKLLEAAIREHLFNYNVKFVATEEFLNRFVRTEKVVNDPRVRDKILGANITGRQTTTAVTGLDLIPSPNTALFNIQLNGAVVSDTMAETPEALVHTAGNHKFRATKQVSYDGGEEFTVWPAQIRVTPHNTTLSVDSAFPVIARNKVEQKRPQAEAVVASRIENRVVPELDTEVNNLLRKTEGKLMDLHSKNSPTAKLFPEVSQFSTEETKLRFNGRLMKNGELGASTPDAQFFSPKDGATLMVHQSLLNNVANRMDLKGQTLSEAQLKSKLEEFLSQVLKRPFTLPTPVKPMQDDDEEANKTPATFIFPEQDPFRFVVEDGKLNVILRAGFKRDGEEDIGTREITIPFNIGLNGNKIELTREPVKVITLEGRNSIAVNGGIRTKIQNLIPDRTLSADLQFNLQGKPVSSTITDITPLDGWIAISVR